MKLTLLHSKEVGDGVISFTFAPEGALQWAAGQSIRLEIPCGYGSDERRFTISSAPYEQEITISTRISLSTFKQALINLQPGTQANGYSIEGTFTWPATDQNILLVAAGVGITPYISMLKQRAHQRLPLHATVLFANTRQAFPFADDLRALQQANSTLKVIWRSSHITAADIVAHVSSKTNVYLSGPEAMVTHLYSELTERHHIPKERIKQDLFSGQLIG